MESFIPNNHVEVTGLAKALHGRSEARRAVAMSGELEQVWDQAMHLSYGAVPLKDKRLVKEVEHMAGRLKLPVAPKLFITKALPRLFGGEAANLAGQLPTKKEFGGAVIITKRAYDGLGKNSQELRALIGHELGHMRQGNQYLNAIQRYPLIIGPIAGIAGAYLLDQAFKKSKGNKPTEQNLEEAADEECRSCRFSLPDSGAAGKDFSENQSKVFNSVVTAGKLVAGAALGFAGGAYYVRKGMLDMEFEADRVGAQLVGDAEPLVKGLQFLHRDIGRNIQTTLKDTNGKWTMLESFQAFANHAHPSLGERIQRVRALTPAQLSELAVGAAEHLR